MSLTYKEIIYHKNKLLQEHKAITPFKLKVTKLWFGLDNKPLLTPNQLAKLLKVKVHYIDSAVFVTMHHLRKWIAKQDLSEEDVERIMTELFK